MHAANNAEKTLKSPDNNNKAWSRQVTLNNAARIRREVF